MKKIKILFYSHTIDFAGTWRSHERILLNLDRNKFDVFVFYNPNCDNNRLEFLKSKLGDNLIPFSASKTRLGPEYGYPYESSDFISKAKEMKFDIIHFARSGYYEWPFIERISPIQVETNIFGGRDNTKYLDCSVTICNTINDIRGGSDYIVYNPIPNKIDNQDSLKEEMCIPDDYIIFGRIGRPANFHPIALESVKILKDSGFYKFKFIIIGACDMTKKMIIDYELSDNCIILDTTNDDNYIHKFLNTIDIFLHYRSDGECHSTAIAQAMIYGKPIVSHRAGYNGQYETIKDGGYVAQSKKDYSEYLSYLIKNKDFYKIVSEKSKLRGMDFEEDKIVKKWENIYYTLYNNYDSSKS